MENRVFAAARPEGLEGGLGREVTLRKLSQSALPFVETSFTDQPLVEAQLRCTLGVRSVIWAKRTRGSNSCSRVLYTQALGPDHPDTLAAWATGHRIFVAVRPGSAQAPRADARATEGSLGPRPQTLVSMNNLADGYAALAGTRRPSSSVKRRCR